MNNLHLFRINIIAWAKLKKMFVWHCLPRVSLGGSVGRHNIIYFFLNIYYLHMDGNGKKKIKKISDLENNFF